MCMEFHFRERYGWNGQGQGQGIAVIVDILVIGVFLIAVIINGDDDNYLVIVVPTSTSQQKEKVEWSNEQRGCVIKWWLSPSIACPRKRRGMVQAWVAHFVTPVKCMHNEYDWRVTSQKPHKKHKHHNKQQHHGVGAARPSSGVDLMNPCRLRGGMFVPRLPSKRFNIFNKLK